MYSCVVLLSALVASGVAVETFVGQCPKIKGMQPFDSKKIVGDWYYLSGNDQVLGDVHCTKLHISVDSHYDKDNKVDGGSCPTDNLHCRGNSYTYHFDFTTLDQQNSVLKFKALMQNSKWGLNSMGAGAFQMEGNSTWSQIYDASFVATDYDNYMAVVFCWTRFDPSKLTFVSRKTGRIYGRQPTMSGEILKTLTNQIGGLNIDVSGHIVKDNAKCGW